MKRRLFNGLTTYGLCALMTLAPTQLSAFFASVKGAGMAVTGIAFPQDSETGAYNPAAISWVGSRVDLGTTPIYTRGLTTVRGNAIPSLNESLNPYNKHWVFNPHFGVTKDFCFCTSKLTAGFVVYNGADLVYCKYNKAIPLLGQSPVRLSYYQEVFAPMMSVKLNECLSVGIACNVFVQRFKLNGLENFDREENSVAPGFVTNNGPSVGYGVGFQVGALADLGKGIKAGFTFAPQTAITRFKRYVGFVANRGKFDAPCKVGGGISARITEDLTFAFDVVWEGWNRVNALHNPFHYPSETFEERLGGDNGSGFAWRDRTFYRGGFNYQATDKLALRAGFRHARTSIPNNTTATNLLVLETIENFIAVGATLKLSECIEGSVFYGHGFTHTIHGENSVPPGLPPAGLGGGEIDITQGRDAFGFSLGIMY